VLLLAAMLLQDLASQIVKDGGNQVMEADSAMEN
jgi:hypothetical protein